MTEQTKPVKIRSRRTHSVGKAENIVQQEKKQRREDPDCPCHEPKDSLFSSSSNYTNYRGLLNLCIIILVVSNSRVALENIMKYGILIDPLQWILFFGDSTSLPSVQIMLSLNVFILISFWIERYLNANDFINEFINKILISANIISLIVIPCHTVLTKECHPIAASLAIGLVTVVCLKLVSYHMVNYWCRREQGARSNHRQASLHSYMAKHYRSRSQSEQPKSKSSDGELDPQTSPKVFYPNNLNLKDIYYFIFAPTLCYELNFPRSQRIRKRFLIRRVIEMSRSIVMERLFTSLITRVTKNTLTNRFISTSFLKLFLSQVSLALIQQWIIPTILNSRKPLQEMNAVRMIERLLKLAVPNIVIWLICFYTFFHSTLNILGEIFKFADREFYRDWWNSPSVGYFWSNWNIPTHKWCLRHLYKPLLRRGFSKCQASTGVFLLSAFFHELLVSVPLKMFRIWAFSGMLFQIPFAMLVSKYLSNNPQIGNIAVWISLIIGQPLCVLMYYHDYYVIHHSGPHNMTMPLSS